MNRFRYAVVTLWAFAITQGCHAQDSDHPWAQMLQIIGYSATAKASFANGCLRDNPLSQTQAYLILCPKLGKIPASVIESAALPFVRKYVTADQAREAIAYYISPVGSNLQGKMLREIESGKYDQLSAVDLQQMDVTNKSAFGRALKNFSMDKEGSSAVARAMLRYEP